MYVEYWIMNKQKIVSIIKKSLVVLSQVIPEKPLENWSLNMWTPLIVFLHSESVLPDTSIGL